ncbi:transposase, partial [Mesorhizobium abyssinicae]
MTIMMLGIDLGKNSCSVAGLDSDGNVVLRRRMQPKRVLSFASKLAPCTVAMEACCGAHYLGRLLAEQGHEVRLMSPEYVRPYVKAQKMGWLPPSPDGIAMCQGRGVQRHEKERTAN